MITASDYPCVRVGAYRNRFLNTLKKVSSIYVTVKPRDRALHLRAGDQIVHMYAFPKPGTNEYARSDYVRPEILTWVRFLQHCSKLVPLKRTVLEVEYSSLGGGWYIRNHWCSNRFKTIDRYETKWCYRQSTHPTENEIRAHLLKGGSCKVTASEPLTIRMESSGYPKAVKEMHYGQLKAWFEKGALKTRLAPGVFEESDPTVVWVEG